MLKHSRTSGSVGVKQQDGSWKGIYCRDLAQPITTGRDVWQMLQTNINSLKRLSGILLKMSTWEEYKNDGICPYCGKVDVGQPCNIRADLFNKCQSGEIAPDPNSNYHKHWANKSNVFSKNEAQDGLWIEWSYIFDPITYELEVLRAVRNRGVHSIRQNGKTWKSPNYQYISLGLFGLFNSEPNWQEVEMRGYRYSNFYYNKHENINARG